MKGLVIVASAFATAVAPSVHAAITRLSPMEIKATFGTGKPFTANSATGSASYTFVLNPDGTATQTSKRKSATVINGAWRVDDKGYCSKWAGSGEHCYTIEKNGNRYSVRDGAGKVVSHWTP